MKKTLLLISAMVLTFTVSAQILETENFNALMVGNVGTVFESGAII